MLTRLLRGFAGDRRGGVLVEAAILMPLLSFVILGGIEVSRYALLQQKLSRTAVAMSDLISQTQGNINLAQIANLFEAAEFVMRPFTLAGNGHVIVSSVVKDAGNPPSVQWQCRRAGTFTPPSVIGVAGGTATLPNGFILRDGESMIYAEVIMDFEPFLFGDVLGSHRIRHTAVFRPRFGALRTLLPASSPPSNPAVCA